MGLEDLDDFGKIGHLFAQQDVFIDELCITFDMVNYGNVVVFTATATGEEDVFIIAQADNWHDFMYELTETYQKLEDKEISATDVYTRHDLR